VRTTSKLAAGATLGLLVVTGCGSSGGSDDDAASTASASTAVLATADTDLGEIVVDAEGRTVYVFDRDTAGSGASACAGSSLDNWPAVTAEEDAPEADGVSGEVATIEGDDGTRQVTVGELPLYTYAGDSDAVDVTGQGVQGVWWVGSPDGTELTETSAPPAPAY
jgi:predicted lipoprotein with Yx(FWY)xxD motif